MHVGRRLVACIALATILLPASALADVRLPNLVGDHMVLQRDAKVRVWGWASPGESVRVEFHGRTARTRADSAGAWSVEAGPFPAGGPYTMTITGQNRIQLRDILMGDVWVASGQSNMEFTLGKGPDGYMVGVLDADRELANSDYPSLRLFRVHHNVGFEPAQEVGADSWAPSTAHSATTFSAVAYLFGRELYRRYQVPIGLIETSWGGTVAEAWMSTQALGSFAEFADDIAAVRRAAEAAAPKRRQAAPTLSNGTDDPNKATVLFNGMIKPLLPYRIKGVIWYQGESNALTNRSAQYRRLFPALIKDWRTQWGQDFPFLFVQLAGYGHNQPQPADYPWSELQEAQAMTLSVPGTGMATAVDLGDENDIHPRNKQDVAHRLFLAALRVAYCEDVVSSGPTYSSMAVQQDSVRIRFSNVGSGLQVKDKYGYLRGFEVAGRDGTFHWAQARQDGDEVVVSSHAVSQPVAVRYSWSNFPDGNLYNKEGLPAPPFRTGTPNP